MKKKVPLEEIYRREAVRLRSMADALFYYEAREEFLAMARRFDRLALLADRAKSRTRRPAAEAPAELAASP